LKTQLDGRSLRLQRLQELFPVLADRFARPFKVYAQVQQAFGRQAFYKVSRSYRDTPASDLPKTDDEKRDQWLIRLSRACGRNLGPFFMAWGVRPPNRRATP